MGCCLALSRQYVAESPRAPRQVLVDARRVDTRSVRSRVMALQIEALQRSHGFSVGDLAEALSVDRKDAFTILHGGRASAEELNATLARWSR